MGALKGSMATRRLMSVPNCAPRRLRRPQSNPRQKTHVSVGARCKRSLNEGGRGAHTFGDHPSHPPDTPPATPFPRASLNRRMLIANPLELRGGSLDAADPQTPHQLTPAAGGVPDTSNARLLMSTRSMCSTYPFHSTGHDRAVGQQDTHRHLALAPQQP
jgi:hypothetical protein